MTPANQTSDAAIRTVELRSPSSRDELRLVLRAAAAIVFGTLFFAGMHAGYGDASNTLGANDLLPFQIRFRDAPADVQRTYREMQEGLTEMLMRRAADGAWPTVDTLAREEIPPFAVDALDRAGVRWTMGRSGLVVNYRGVPTVAGADPAEYLILVQEPDPTSGERPSSPAVVDEEHRLLPDGTLLHATCWTRTTPPSEDPGPIARPDLAGWSQIRAAG